MGEIYVDPSQTSDVGLGTKVSPWGRATGSVIQYALDNGTWNSSDGVRINVLDQGTDTLSSSLSLGGGSMSPSFGAPLVIQGYTTDEGDGGVGVIDCNGNAVHSMSANQNIHWHDLEMSDGPATGALLVLANSYWGARRVYVHNSTQDGIESGATLCDVVFCRIEDCGRYGINITDRYCKCWGNYLNDGTKTFDQAIRITSYGSIIAHNIIEVTDSAADGIVLNGSAAYNDWVVGNSIRGSGSGGDGIICSGSNNVSAQLGVFNNAVEGFNGSGGYAFDISTTSGGVGVVGENVENNPNNSARFTSEGFLEVGTLFEDLTSASPFVESGSNTFATRNTYFEPADEGTVRTGALPENL